MKRFDTISIHRVLNYKKLTDFRKIRKFHNGCILEEKIWEQIVQDDSHTEQSFSWTKKQVEYIEKYGWNKWWYSNRPYGPFGPYGFEKTSEKNIKK